MSSLLPRILRISACVVLLLGIAFLPSSREEERAWGLAWIVAMLAAIATAIATDIADLLGGEGGSRWG